jgi:hypothetical protein
MSNTLVSLIAGLLVWGSFATAQSNFTLTRGAEASIPFRFMVGNQEFPAGTYIVQLDFEKQVVVIRNEDRRVRIFLSKNDERRQATPKTQLVFRHLGDQFFLNAVWLEGTTAGERLLPGNRETELARHQSGPPQTLALQAQHGANSPN